MTHALKVWTVLALFIVSVAGCSTIPHKPDSFERGDYRFTREYITWLIKKEMKQQDITGLSIALVDDQGVVWSEGFGFADQAHKVPATAETIYRVGSISKLFTATAAMQLAEQGVLDIDQPLLAYLPEFSINTRFPDAGPITPRTIMTHHSGLPSDLLKGMWTTHPEPFENEVIRLQDEFVANPPNYVFSYSNVGVTLLGHALEKAAGRAFASLLEASVLRPLGMSHSMFSPAPTLSSLGAKAYNKGKEVEELPLRGIPAGGLNSTVLDLSRFMEMVFAEGRAGDRQIIKPETLAEMLRPQNSDVPLDLDFRIGLGWMLSGLGVNDVRNAGLVAQHSGATMYYRSQLIVLPEHKLGVVVLSNSATAGRVVTKVATETLKLALEAKTGITQPSPLKMKESEGTLPPQELQAYEGYYATMAGVVGITKKSDYLKAEVMGSSLRLVPRTDGQLGLRYRLLGFIPISLGELEQVGFSRAMVAGREIIKASMNGREMLIGERIHPVQIPAAMQKLVGDYEIVNAGEEAVLVDNVRVRLDNGLLLVEYSLPLFSEKRMSNAIAPLSESEAVIYGLGRGMGETIRIVDVGGEKMILYSGYVLRKKRE